MTRNTLKIAVTMLSIVLFASCKSTSDSESNDGTSKKRQGGQPSVTQLLSEMDSNKDGKLSKDEVKGPLANDFSKIDTDKDGFLSEEELKNAPKPDRQGGGGQGRPQRN
ncbi:EF-hand domain-containing protein [Winogradskyella sp. Asnod2-B02-A]|uniref:EF-hand domain-containing protein n=1 Tax=Winogradskyella sp. Asnod2-B02-A TaxID=3160583 RepID=UPI00386E3DD9